MKRSNRLILLIGVFLAIVAFVGIVLISGPKPPDGPAVVTEGPVVVAAVDIPLGTSITADMVKTEVVKVEDQLPGFFGSVTEVIDKRTTRAISTGAQMTEDLFSTSTGANVAEQIPLGNRAIAVQVDQVSGVGTLIQPGDRVDMIIGFASDKFPVISIDPQAQDGSGVTVVSGLNNTSVKMLLQGMQVIGTLLPPPTAPAEGQAPAEGGETPATLTGQQEIVLLSVTAQQAEVIKFAQLDGTISLVLRSLEDFQDENGQPVEPVLSPTTGVTLKVLVDEYGVLVPQLVETLLPAVGR
ncbi:MAG TPA: Flp pilus assembly protein CpaB [Candidatus Limnocylindrales bacterium]